MLFKTVHPSIPHTVIPQTQRLKWTPNRGVEYIWYPERPVPNISKLIVENAYTISGSKEHGLWSILDDNKKLIYNVGFSKDAMAFRKKTPFWEEYLNDTVEINPQVINGGGGFNYHGNVLNTSAFWFNIEQYWHFFFEDLPLIPELLKLDRHIPIITQKLPTWQMDILYQFYPDIVPRLRQVSTPAILRGTAIAFSYPAISNRGIVHPDTVKFLRSTMTGTRLPNSPSRIYVSREDSSARRVLNEDELMVALARFNFKKVVLSKLSIREKLDLFYNAEIVVGATGGGLTHCFAMKRGSRVFDFNHPYEIPYESGWNHMGDNGNLSWLTMNIVKDSIMSPDIRNQKAKNADMIVDVPAIEAYFRELKL